MNRQKRTKIVWMTTMQKLTNQRGSFTSIAGCDNPAKCVLRVAVAQTTIHQAISHKDSSLIRQILSDLPENELVLTDIVDMISKKKTTHQK